MFSGIVCTMKPRQLAEKWTSPRSPRERLRTRAYSPFKPRPRGISPSEIAREAGVSPHTVDAVAAGKRVAISTERPLLNDGEQFLPEPIRCSGCRAKIEVGPCRACGAS